jgi:hypothetical protein
MAYEQPGFSVGVLTAAASMSGKQHYIVKKNATANQFALCDTDGEILLGVLQDEPASGEAGDIMCTGITKVVANETLAAGDYWGTSSDGQATKIEHSNTGADVGDYVGGQVIVGAAVGEKATVTVGFPTFKVESV